MRLNKKGDYLIEKKTESIELNKFIFHDMCIGSTLIIFFILVLIVVTKNTRLIFDVWFWLINLSCLGLTIGAYIIAIAIKKKLFVYFAKQKTINSE